MKQWINFIIGQCQENLINEIDKTNSLNQLNPPSAILDFESTVDFLLQFLIIKFKSVKK